MARTRSSAKQAQFLDAALRLFVAQGVQNTSTAEIARAAGAAAGTLFLYFPTKQELIHELLRRISREQSQFVSSRLHPALSVRDRFWTIWEASVRWFLEHMDAYRYVQQVRNSSLVAESVVQETGASFAYYYDAVEQGLAEASIKPYPLDLIGGFLYQDVVATLNCLQQEPDPVRREALIRQGFDLFWSGIAVRRESAGVEPAE
jgi:AcrR family transcriptional regulator